jgi:hypothetical protein
MEKVVDAGADPLVKPGDRQDVEAPIVNHVAA